MSKATKVLDLVESCLSLNEDELNEVTEGEKIALAIPRAKDMFKELAVLCNRGKNVKTSTDLVIMVNQLRDYYHELDALATKAQKKYK